MKVTFVSEVWVAPTAARLPEDTSIGAQYDVMVDGIRVYAVIWEHPEEEDVIHRLPIPALSVPFPRALSTLSEVFGLNIGCQKKA